MSKGIQEGQVQNDYSPKTAVIQQRKNVSNPKEVVKHQYLCLSFYTLTHPSRLFYSCNFNCNLLL